VERPVSIIVPVYNAAPTLRELHARIVAAMEGISDDFEIIFVNDASADSSAEIIKRLTEQDSRVRTFTHERNYGQFAALRTGIRQAEGEILVTLDDDLQHRPEDIPRLLSTLAEGSPATLVMAVPTARRRAWYRDLSAMAIHAVSNLFLDKPIPVRLTTFCAYHAGLGEVISRPGSLRAEAWITSLVQSADRVAKVPVRIDGSGLAQSRYDLRRLSQLFRARARWFSLRRGILLSATASLLTLALLVAAAQFGNGLGPFVLFALAITCFGVAVICIAITTLTFVERQKSAKLGHGEDSASTRP
jgi:glycosyltransferase involved in cell wall biosynthesis